MVREFEQRIPLKKAFLWIFLSVLAVSGSATFGWLYYLHWKGALQTSSKYPIKIIVQTTPQTHFLESDFFAEVLGLSTDHPVNLYAFNAAEGEKILRRHPLIKNVRIEKIPPETIHIEYEMRSPIAFIADFVNVAVDQEGIMIPFYPFFTPKKLPKLYLGLEAAVWGQPLETESYQACLKILRHCQDHEIEVRSLDTSRMFAPSYGEREIIVQIDEKVDYILASRVLRLNPRDPIPALNQYFLMKNHLPPSGVTIDLRIKDLAFIRLTH